MALMTVHYASGITTACHWLYRRPKEPRTVQPAEVTCWACKRRLARQKVSRG